MTFSEQGVLKAAKTQCMACLHMRCVRLCIANYSQHGGCRAAHSSGVLCGFSTMVPTWEGLQGFAGVTDSGEEAGRV